jgi:LCP family protein required for cell wall assembly
MKARLLEAAPQTPGDPQAAAPNQPLTNTSDALPGSAANLSISSSRQPVCGAPLQMILLGIGIDTLDDSYTYGLGDAIRIVRIDFVARNVSVLALPRDLWVEIPMIRENYDITHGKLNQAYLYGAPGMGYYSGPGGGAGLMARTLEVNFGLRVDHYGVLNMRTFARLIDAVGGIDLYLPYGIDGTPLDGFSAEMNSFLPGQHHLTGDQALRLSRLRKRYNDLTRIQHQNMVLNALGQKLLSPAILPKIPEMIGAFQNSAITDLSLEQISQLGCLLSYMENDDLIFASLPEEIFTSGRVYSPQMRSETFILRADFEVISAYLQEFLAGRWPEALSGNQETCDQCSQFH